MTTTERIAPERVRSIWGAGYYAGKAAGAYPGEAYPGEAGVVAGLASDLKIVTAAYESLDQERWLDRAGAELQAFELMHEIVGAFRSASCSQVRTVDLRRATRAFVAAVDRLRLDADRLALAMYYEADEDDEATR